MADRGGELIVQGGGKVAQLDDRDMAQAMDMLELDGETPGDEALLAWIVGAEGKLNLRYKEQRVAVERIGRDQLESRFGFTRIPAP